MAPRRHLVAVVAGLAALAIVVRIPPAIHDPLWLDETVSARVITMPTVGAALRRVQARESSPPGWHLMNRSLRDLGGDAVSMERLRALSIAFSVALAVGVLGYGLSLSLPLWSATVAAMLTVLGTNFVAHGAELRPYSMLALVSLVFALALEAAARRPTRGRLLLLALVVAIGALTHYFFLLGIGTAIVWLALVAPPAARFRVGASVAIGLLALVPWLPSFLHQYRHDLFAYLGPFNTRPVLYAYPRIVGLLGERGIIPAAGRLAFAFLVIVGIVVLVRRYEGALVGFMATVPVVLSAVLWLLGPRIFNERNLLVAGPFVALAVAAALTAMPRAAAVVVSLLLAVALGTSLWRYEVGFGRASYDGIASALVDEGWRPEGVVVQFGPAPLGLIRPVGWYLPGRPELTATLDVRCAPRLFVISYDSQEGPVWLRRHDGRILARRTFMAYDHTPRGPETQPPIVVAALGRPDSLAANARRHGGRLFTAVPCST